MSRFVLLVDPDLDALGTLAAQLRARGLTVTLADTVESAFERLRGAHPEVVLIAEALGADAIARLESHRELSVLPRFVLVGARDGRALSEHELPADEVDTIAKRVYALASKPHEVVGERGDFRGDLSQVSVVDLLQLLSMNRRTGGLSITTAAGAGEVRLLEGEIVDAVYRRLDGEKALFRLLDETEGSFSFASGSPALLRRVQTKTTVLLMEGMRQIDELRRRRDTVAADDDALLSIAPPPPEAEEAAHRVAELLTVPRTLDELLDDIALPDLEIIEALADMLERGSVRRIAKGAVRVELADAEQLTVLSALVKRHARGTFDGPPRVVLVGSPRRLATLSHAVSRIADAVAPAENAPAAPVPHLLATLRLADFVELDVVGLPEVDAYCPVWGLSLPGAVVAIRVEPPETAALDEVCAVTGVPLLDARRLQPELDEADPAQIAALIRCALETVAAP